MSDTMALFLSHTALPTTFSGETQFVVSYSVFFSAVV